MTSSAPERRMRRSAFPGVLLCLALPCLVSIRADEVVLRDGTRLKGTITAMEQGHYRLETDFGVALIRRERIARIEFSEDAAGQPGGTAEDPAGGGRASPAETARGTRSASARPARPLAAAPPPPPPVVRERKPPGGTIQERTEGNTYINETFRFELFKPPTWRVLRAEAQNIPSAVTVLGTDDRATMLVVGTVLYNGSAEAYARILHDSLRGSYADFAPEPEEKTEVAGRPAIRRSFTGVSGGSWWHGTVVNVADGDAHFGIIGVTRDERFRFKESVISKIVHSFRFR